MLNLIFIILSVCSVPGLAEEYISCYLCNTNGGNCEQERMSCLAKYGCEIVVTFEMTSKVKGGCAKTKSSKMNECTHQSLPGRGGKIVTTCYCNTNYCNGHTHDAGDNKVCYWCPKPAVKCDKEGGGYGAKYSCTKACEVTEIVTRDGEKTFMRRCGNKKYEDTNGCTVENKPNGDKETTCYCNTEYCNKDAKIKKCYICDSNNNLPCKGEDGGLGDSRGCTNDCEVEETHTADGEVTYVRRCSTRKYDVTNICYVDKNLGGVTTKICRCDSNNCNANADTAAVGQT